MRRGIERSFEIWWGGKGTNHEDAIAQRNVEDFVQMDELRRENDSRNGSVLIREGADGRLELTLG